VNPLGVPERLVRLLQKMLTTCQKAQQLLGGLFVIVL
jgi:hypothetical protein